MSCQSLGGFICCMSRPVLKLLDWITPLIALLARIWVSYIFFKSGLLKLSNWGGTIMLFMHEFHIPILTAEIEAVIATAAELILPVLITLGLGTRLMPFALFLFNLVAMFAYPYLWTPDGLPGLLQHVNWGLILGLLMTFGMGSWTLDRLFWSNRCCHPQTQ